MWKERVDTCASLASSLILAAVVVTGLTVLCAENLGGRSPAQQMQFDHSTAIHKLLFRA